MNINDFPGKTAGFVLEGFFSGKLEMWRKPRQDGRDQTVSPSAECRWQASPKHPFSEKGLHIRWIAIRTDSEWTIIKPVEIASVTGAGLPPVAYIALFVVTLARSLTNTESIRHVPSTNHPSFFGNQDSE